MRRPTYAKLWVSCLCFLLISAVCAQRATAADDRYPAKPIKFLVHLAAGGVSDVLCRKLSDIAGKAMGQEIIIENKVGAGGLVAASFLAKSKPDGYLIGALPSSTFIISPNFTKMDFDPSTSFTPIMQIFGGNMTLSVAANSPVKTVKDFVELGQKRVVTVAVTGLNTSEIAVRRLASKTKMTVKIVPFASAPASMLALMGNQVDAYAGGGQSYEYVRAGKIRVVARLTDEDRGPFKDIPSLKSLGYDIDAPAFLGVFGPKGLPANVHRRLEEEYSKAMQDPSTAKTFDSFGETQLYRNSADFGKYVKEVYEQGRREFKELGLGIYAKENK